MNENSLKWTWSNLFDVSEDGLLDPLFHQDHRQETAQDDETDAQHIQHGKPWTTRYGEDDADQENNDRSEVDKDTYFTFHDLPPLLSVHP